MATIRSICVYCGSGNGHAAVHLQAAKEFGAAMGKAGLRLVYGGGGTGLMGALAGAVIENGGQVTGIIPEFLKRKEMAMDGVQEMITVPDMHVRKMMMFHKADSFVALPGGIGTLEELVEQLTWAQLGRHRKPVVIANIAGFWDPLKVLLAHMREEGFIRPELAVKYTLVERAAEIIPTLQEAVADLPDEALSEEHEPVLIGKM
ncbi:TIGR00730 family Rossman fold protein [Phreatobacter stygius]|uniref:Cytokinin riboside 5'-monophosphate phosphoribohydrolase n=1 Tax=Phreatobacter stygius TaxID=1940610 RepID=A0A4D7B1G5_9HYPH|nr:TIGR00730 family Rossman fold protein [Phreatobacter stygius]QCI67549.1 TIGR00730 family Rossman fold protein [Phreatobacter stygius]